MRRPRYPILATDLDGTLVGPDLRIVPESGRALRRYLAAGGRVVIATGRTEQSIETYRDALDVNGLAIVYQGARIADLETREAVLERHLRPGTFAVTRGMLAGVVPGEVAVLAFTGSEVLALEPRGDVAREALAAYRARDRVPVRTCRDGLALDGLRLLKILLVVPVSSAAALESRLSGALPDSHVVRSEPMYVEVLDGDVDKGSALAWLLARWGADGDEVVAVGNGLNDRELLATAGIGVAVGDGHPGLRQVADIVVRSCLDGGVADAVAIALGEREVPLAWGPAGTRSSTAPPG